jgi:hypothetical protein
VGHYHPFRLVGSAQQARLYQCDRLQVL